MEKNNSLVKAINKNVRTSPRKLALVCNFIKGKKADVALRDLEFSRKRISKDVSKTVKSAISNAENNYQYDIDNYCSKYKSILDNFQYEENKDILYKTSCLVTDSDKTSL